MFFLNIYIFTIYCRINLIWPFTSVALNCDFKTAKMDVKMLKKKKAYLTEIDFFENLTRSGRTQIYFTEFNRRMPFEPLTSGTLRSESFWLTSGSWYWSNNKIVSHALLRDCGVWGVSRVAIGCKIVYCFDGGIFKALIGLRR